MSVWLPAKTPKVVFLIQLENCRLELCYKWWNYGNGNYFLRAKIDIDVLKWANGVYKFLNEDNGMGLLTCFYIVMQHEKMHCFGNLGGDKHHTVSIHNLARSRILCKSIKSTDLIDRCFGQS